MPIPEEDIDPLTRLTAGDLTELIYGELRGLARHRQRGDRIAAAMNPTSLIHRVYVRLAKRTDATWQSKGHFVAAAAEAMRRICIDEARAQAALKRGGGRARIPLSDVMDEAHAATLSAGADILSLNEALERLERINNRAAEIVKLRFFAGLTINEVAALLGRSTRTIDRDWEHARAWLFAELTSDAV